MSTSTHPVELDVAEAMAILERTPASLRSLLEGLPERLVLAPEGEGKWSPFDVVGHLIHGERTNWMVRTRHILSGEPSPLPAFDRTAMFSASRGRGLGELLDTFAELRSANLAELEDLSLSRADLARAGVHPELGATTLEQLLATWVVHDLDHLAQVVRTLAKAYRAEVGPWARYLSILRDRE